MSNRAFRRPPTHLAALPAAATLTLILALAGCTRPTPTPTATPTPSASPTASPTASRTPTPSATPTPTFPADALVEAEALNLRAGPDTLHPAVQVIHRATPVAIRGRNDDGSWLAVRSPAESEGWISARYVSLRRAYDTIPIVPTPSPPPTPSPTPVPIDPAQPIVLSPPAVAQGDPLLVRVRSPGSVQVVAALGEQAVDLVPLGSDTFAGLLGVPPDLEPGQHAVHVTAINAAGEPVSDTATLLVHDARFGAESILLGGDAGRLLDPVLRQAETDRLAALWMVRTPEKLWQGRWHLPIDGTVSSPFGTRRDYNQGTISAWHTGLDLRGRSGTPVHAPARGRVVLAEPLLARGGTVWLDHGWGVYSGYFHLAAISVSPEMGVEPGAELGIVGATGTATGPHLHWEVRVGGVEVQPVQWVLRDVGAVP